MIGDASLNGTIADIYGKYALRGKPPIKGPIGPGAIILELFLRILNGGGTAPRHASEINPITNSPYADPAELELVEQLTEEQRDTLTRIINSKDPKFAPFVPDDLLDKSEVDTERGCFSVELVGHLGEGSIGKRAAAARYATEVSGSDNDFLVIDKEGNNAFYDGVVNPKGAGYSVIQPLLGTTPFPEGTTIVVEAKRGYEWLNRFIRPENQLPPGVTRLRDIAYDSTLPERWQIRTYNRIVDEINNEAKVAKNCGLLFFVSFNRYQAFGSGVELFSYNQTKVIEEFADAHYIPAQGQKTR